MMTTAISDAEFYIGSRLAAARRMRDVSQEELAQRLGVTCEEVQQYEQGRNLITVGRLCEIARALQVNVSFFYEGLNGSTSCPFALTDERFTLIKRAMQRIAADYELTGSGRRKKLPRHEAINVARQVCEALGWDYSYKCVTTNNRSAV